MDRNEKVIAALKTNPNLTEVGARFGLSRQRVYQIRAVHEKRTGVKLPRKIVGDIIMASFGLPEELYRRAQEYAKKQNKSLSTIYRQALEIFLGE
jgi:hypothetical protein